MLLNILMDLWLEYRIRWGKKKKSRKIIFEEIVFKYFLNEDKILEWGVGNKFEVFSVGFKVCCIKVVVVKYVKILYRLIDFDVIESNVFIYGLLVYLEVDKIM